MFLKMGINEPTSQMLNWYPSSIENMNLYVCMSVCMRAHTKAAPGGGARAPPPL